MTVSSTSRFRHRRVCAAVAAAWLASSSLAYAGGLDSLLDGMMTHTTSPAVYQSQSRMGLVGGELTMRIPNRPITIISFDPPRVSAGCGGIDMFAGAFSFINTQELTALFRGIVQMAPAALFKMAINSISPQLGTAMQEFQEKIQALNSMFKNSCQISTGIVNGTWSPMAFETKVQDVGKAFAGVLGAAESTVSGLLSGDSKAPPAQPAWSPIAQNNSEKGNLLYRAIVRNPDLMNKINFLGHSNLSDAEKGFLIELMLNIGGSIASLTDDKKDAGSCDARTPDPLGGDDKNKAGCVNTPPKWPGNRLTMNMLMSPTDGDTVIGCGELNINEEFSCQKPLSKTFASNGVSFQGTRAWVNKALYGINKPVITPDEIGTGGFVGAILNGRAVTTEEKAAISSLPVPIFRHLMMVQHDKSAVFDVAQKLAPIMAEDMAVSLADSLLQATKDAYAGKVNIVQPPGYNENLAAFAQEINTVRRNAGERMKVQLDAIVLVDYIRKSMNTPPAAAGGVPGSGR